MNKRQAENWTRTQSRLMDMGLSRQDVDALFRIERTLQRWGELECGDERGNAIERDEVTGKPFMTYDRGHGPRGRYAVADRERGALQRLGRVMSRYPALVSYNQGDPRGCALYILKKSDLKRGDDISALYNRGVAVCY